MANTLENYQRVKFFYVGTTGSTFTAPTAGDSAPVVSSDTNKAYVTIDNVPESVKKADGSIWSSIVSGWIYSVHDGNIGDVNITFGPSVIANVAVQVVGFTIIRIPFARTPPTIFPAQVGVTFGTPEYVPQVAGGN